MINQEVLEMKKNYTSPELTLVEFAESQVILTSGYLADEDIFDPQL